MSLGDIGRARKLAGSGHINFSGFTLVELLVVVVIIAILVTLVLGIASYAQDRGKRSRASVEMATLSLACEQFKQDNGRYPTSSVYRISMTYSVESHDSSLLYQQIGSYLSSSNLKVGTNVFDVCGQTDISATNFFAMMDPWETPYNYYCTYSPLTTATNVIATCFGIWGPNDSTEGTISMGGQRNAVTFDLFSYGPDRKTYETKPSGSRLISHVHDDPKYLADDITNFR